MKSAMAILLLAWLSYSKVLPAQESVRIPGCVVNLIEEAQVPAAEPGVLKTLAIQEGQSVKQGELLAGLDDSDALAKLRVAEFQHRVVQAQADSDARVRAAKAEAEVVEVQYLRGERRLPNESGDLDEEDLKRLLLAPRRAKLHIEVAQLEHQIAKLNSEVKRAEVEHAKALHDKRRVISPLSGIVIKIYRHLGEWVAAGEPIAHVVRMDRMRVVGYVPADQWSQSEIMGRPVDVLVNVRRGLAEKYSGKVGFASPVVEADGRYRIWVEIENRQVNGFWSLRPGLTAEFVINVAS